MRSACLLALASVVLSHLTVSGAQGVPGGEEPDPRSADDDAALRRAESLLLRTILRNLQDEDGGNDDLSDQPEWLSKRQHPGKRYLDVEKRQHPGRREEDGDGMYAAVEKRQHPGKREDQMRSVIQKRQHPGKRSVAGRLSDPTPGLLGDLSKRQHPGKRFLLLHNKRQHPGEAAWDADADADEDFPDLEKRQHPGKRFWDTSSADLDAGGPCDALDPTRCSKTGLLLDFLDNVDVSRAEEKRQHPGKRFALQGDLVEEE